MVADELNFTVARLGLGGIVIVVSHDVGIDGVPSSLVGTDERASRFVASRVIVGRGINAEAKEKKRVASGPLSGRVLGHWGTVHIWRGVPCTSVHDVRLRRLAHSSCILFGTRSSGVLLSHPGKVFSPSEKPGERERARA